MKEVDLNELMHVIGGRAIASASRNRVDSNLQLALTKLASDIKEVARPQQNTTAMMMMAAVVASRRFA